MTTSNSHFQRWETFAIKPRQTIHPFKLFLTVIKWTTLFAFVVIFFWGMGTLFFQKSVSISKVAVLDENGKATSTYTSGVFFEIITEYSRNLIYKKHIFNLDTNGALYEYDYFAVDNIGDAWKHSTSPFYALFAFPISWLLTKITEGLQWNEEALGSNKNLTVMILGIFLTSLILRIVTGVGSWKQQQNQFKMNSLQGKVNDIKAKYRDVNSLEAKQKQQLEIMQLYRQAKINPLSTALEGFAFAPFLFAMFVVVRSSRILKDSSTETFSFSATIWDSLTASQWIYLVPVVVYLAIMAVDTFLLPRILNTQSKKKIITSDQQGKSTKRNWLKWGLKILFIVFFFMVPVGTSVYWIFSSFFESCQKLLLNQVRKIHRKKIIAKKRGMPIPWWNLKRLFEKV